MRWASLLLAAFLVGGCSADSNESPPVDAQNDLTNLPLDTAEPEDIADEPIWPHLDGSLPYETLSEYNFFSGILAEQIPNAGVFPYTVNSALWSDHAVKHRFLVLPEGTTLDFDLHGEWTFPTGTILIKTFFFPEDLSLPTGPGRLVETRLLIFDGVEWTGHVYIWNEEETEALREVAGKFTTVEYLLDGEAIEQTYIIPNNNQCKNCHEIDDFNRPLGPNTRQLNREVFREGEDTNQLRWLEEHGVFSAPLPEGDWPALAQPFSDAPLADRARSYLEANCAHCHQPGGGGGVSGLSLLASETHPATYGICKAPIAAGPGSGGFIFDIVPGHPEESILIFRMSSVDPQLKMPELPNLIAPLDGVELVSEWILSLEGDGCVGPSLD